MNMNKHQKLLASIVLIAVVAVAGYFALSKKSDNVSTTKSPVSSILSAPSVSYVGGDKPYVQINIDYTCDKSYNFYRSADDINWVKLFTVDFKTFSRGPGGPNGEETFGCSGGGSMDENFPKDATQLYYKYALLGDNGQEIKQSEVVTLNISTNTDASNWKTYTNNKFGFEIKYPSDWWFQSDESGAVLVEAKCSECDPPALTINGGVVANMDLKGCTPMNFASVLANKCLSTQDSMFPGTPEIFFSKNGIPFAIFDDINNEVSQQILSTFKFTEFNVASSTELTIEGILNSNGFINGERHGNETPPDGATGLPVETIDKNRIVFGDLNGDGVNEAIAPISWCDASCGQSVYAFELYQGKIISTEISGTHVAGAAQAINSLKIKNELVVVSETDFDGTRTNSYRVSIDNNGKLVSMPQ